MEWIKLIGIVIIVLGFVFKFDTLATVIIAGLVTALVSGISLPDFLSTLGQAYADQRIVSLFFLSLPMIGLTEKFGLKQQAIRLIGKLKGLTTGGLYSLYMLIRIIAGAFSIRLGGHPQFVRPLIYPMGEAAAKLKVTDDLSEGEVETIKARAAANENFGNFYGQNIFLGSAGVLLMAGTLQELGYDGTTAQIARASVPIGIIALVVVTVYNLLLDVQVKRRHAKGDHSNGND
ncbi:DUF969 domain-containing protein [Facklamia sp. DSM 111018]|uniref:DUF969 domain-containing protein n=1 Tax=Facklamia lactis TaxID=2749967 RepID=A0ABS0LRN1_9LACT|nr:DUF969 domain-containing protein [Facklamia lactis]MBG9980940.1 DUF969 domain-containing protein [Facklamia lactis]MBG9986697.1 DUF969 domain-containing protein [Facklamia lactis]